MKKDIFVILGFDMETDCGSWFPYYNGLINGTPLLLNLLNSKKIKGTFFFTGESAKLYPEVCKDVLRNGHEVGCHSLYHETVGDPIFEIPGIKPLLPGEIKERLKVATNIVAKSTGRKPLSFRSPRLWGGTTCVNALEELGYLVDVSYPMYYYEKQLVPYHPSKDNWLEKGEMKIVEIPNFADMTINPKDPYKRDRDQWPLFRTKSTDELIVHIMNFIKYIQEKNLPVVICFYFHPWEFIEMPKKFQYEEGTVIPDGFIVKNCGQYALKQLDKLVDSLKIKEATFNTAEEIARNFKW
jgi:peptidoglycan/xylan/chitin deacetylase (PgdA/CDA1 family)